MKGKTVLLPKVFFIGKSPSLRIDLKTEFKKKKKKKKKK